MYKKIIINLAMAMITPLAIASPMEEADEALAYATAADSNFYFETARDVKLTVFHPDVTGKMSVTSQISVPQNSILAVKLSSFTYSVNENWVCGIRIVDVMDEDLRESDAADEQDFCIRTDAIKNTKLLESSNGKNKEAFLNYLKTGQVKELHDLGFQAYNPHGALQNYQTFKANISSGGGIISPLKNCGVGCLTVTSEYGMRKHPVLKTKRLHKGIDLRAKTGTQVVSVYDGKVLATRTEKNQKTGKMKGYGHYVIVIHPHKGVETLYAHLSGFKTSAGRPVTQGQTIALSGNTGIGTAPHLHFEIHKRKNNTYVPVNPRTYVTQMLNVSL
ncbi:MAG: M23 family metallopeptidase [Pseudobdellovibrio sp.]|nr:M23 family metallopeptidase [Pseudobdellovibrio sp.]